MKSSLFQIFTGLMLTLAKLASAYPHGAPLSTCENMYPKHKHIEQTDHSPFAVVPIQNEVLSNSCLNLTLKSSDSSDEHQFKGFLTMAFEENSNPTNKALGTFQTDIHSHSMDCHGLSQNAATHSSKSYKAAVNLVWCPPEDFQGSVVFVTTWVVSKKVFWLKETSAPVHVKLAQNVDDTIIQDVRMEILVEDMSCEIFSCIGLGWALYGILFASFILSMLLVFAIRYFRVRKYATLVTEQVIE